MSGVQECRFVEQAHEHRTGRRTQRGGFIRGQGRDAAQQMAVQKFVERGGLKAGERILKAEIFRRLAGKVSGHGFGGGVGIAIGEVVVGMAVLGKK